MSCPLLGENGGGANQKRKVGRDAHKAHMESSLSHRRPRLINAVRLFLKTNPAGILAQKVEALDLSNPSRLADKDGKIRRYSSRARVSRGAKAELFLANSPNLPRPPSDAHANILPALRVGKLPHSS